MTIAPHIFHLQQIKVELISWCEFDINLESLEKFSAGLGLIFLSSIVSILTVSFEYKKTLSFSLPLLFLSVICIFI